MIEESLNMISKEISKGSSTKISFSFKNLFRNIKNGITNGYKESKKISGFIPIIGNRKIKIAGAVLGGLGGLLNSFNGNLEITKNKNIKSKK